MTRTERIIDASVLVAFLLQEDVSGAAEACSGDTFMVAPDFIRLEVASAVAKAVWRGRVSEAQGLSLVAAVDDVVDLYAPTSGLARTAFQMSARHRCSAYDASYLALAIERDAVVITADHRFADRAAAGGFGRHVERIG